MVSLRSYVAKDSLIQGLNRNHDSGLFWPSWGGPVSSEVTAPTLDLDGVAATVGGIVAVSRIRTERPIAFGGRKVRPTTRRTLRALGGRRVVVESFGKYSPTLVTIVGGNEVPSGAWLAPSELRRFVEAARKILK
jgi:hypothetical protein